MDIFSDSTKYQALFHSDEKYERISDRIRYFIMLKSNISDVYSHKSVNSDDDLPLEKTSNMHDVVILVKSFFSKSQMHYYYQVFIEKFLYLSTE